MIKKLFEALKKKGFNELFINNIKVNIGCYKTFNKLTGGIISVSLTKICGGSLELFVSTQESGQRKISGHRIFISKLEDYNVFLEKFLSIYRSKDCFSEFSYDVICRNKGFRDKILKVTEDYRREIRDKRCDFVDYLSRELHITIEDAEYNAAALVDCDEDCLNNNINYICKS